MSRPDKRQTIMLAAERLFACGRFERITLDQVAAAAHVGKGTIYLYFRDKEDLFFQTATSGFAELCELIARAVPVAALFEEQLLTVAWLLSEFYERRRTLLRMMRTEAERIDKAHPGLRRRWLAQRKKMVQAVAGIMARGITQGRVTSDLPAEVLANYFLGMLRTRGCDLEGCPRKHRAYAAMVRLFCRGVCKKDDEV